MTRIAGLDLGFLAARPARGGSCARPSRVGLGGSDYPGLHLRAVASEGDAVRAGDPVLCDRARPEIVVTAPIAGIVEQIAIGARRRVTLAVIRAEGEEARRFEIAEGAAGVRAAMLDSGLWCALLRRPFGRIPPPDEVPAAIAVTAIATDPGAADPATEAAGDRDGFARGLAALEMLTEGPVHVCQGPGPALAEERGRIRIARFRGGHPAGLPGLHLERLCPVTAARPAWQIAAADVLALGGLLGRGTPPGDRAVALGGDLVAEPRLVPLPIGADLAEIATREAGAWPRRVLSGSPLSGVESRFLRRRHQQVTVAHRLPDPGPQRSRFGIVPKRPALVPHAALSRALGPDLPAIPILRALSVADTDAAAGLGALGLLEEDMALATYLSGGTEDFGALLRGVLDRLEAEA